MGYNIKMNNVIVNNKIFGALNEYISCNFMANLTILKNNYLDNLFNQMVNKTFTY